MFSCISSNGLTVYYRRSKLIAGEGDSFSFIEGRGHKFAGILQLFDSWFTDKQGISDANYNCNFLLATF